MDQLGQSFSPLNTDPTQPQGPNTSSPLQDAIKILSFRMPKVVGAASPSPLAGQGTGGIADWLTKLLQGLLPPTGGALASGGPTSPFGGPMGGAPTMIGGGMPPVGGGPAPNPVVQFTPPQAPRLPWSPPPLDPGELDRTNPAPPQGPSGPRVGFPRMPRTGL